jgi:hypothetical protein
VAQNQLHLVPSIQLGLRKKPDGNVMYGHDFIRSRKQQTASTLENLLKFNQQFVKSPSTAPIQGGHATHTENDVGRLGKMPIASAPAEKSLQFPFALRPSHLAAQTHKGPDATSAFEAIRGSKAQNMGISPQMPFQGTAQLSLQGTAQFPSQGYAGYGFEHAPQQNMQMPAMPQLPTRTIEYAGSFKLSNGSKNVDSEWNEIAV